ncbi:MAG: DUF1631 family protein [Methylobacter sp.]|nr:DUF1631 family protein [Methylobacter sp.]MDP2099756.1 DUF1631 family protein [Methylobacter sp.]MDP2427940.1 DUF1631 family protein [Methylobacter sp.]MDP3055835.1 DUF1631 family protein [Methylobacter sp.]MDP3361662.1 DUF1631 family protein [Methylobacter sp.]
MVTKDKKASSDDWMVALLKAPIFQRLPPINLQKVLLKLEAVEFKKDEIIIEQGREGDYYYLIKNGQCLCTRKASPTAKSIKIRELVAGDTFGEDALLSGAPRDLTITALTDMSLLRLDKERFISLIKQPSLIFVNYSEMQEARKKGAILLDVRTPEDYKKHHIKGSVNEPFFSLRMQLHTLNRDKRFIVVCADGKISEAAAFLLLNNGMEAKVLKGGMAGITEAQDNGRPDGGSNPLNTDDNTQTEPAVHDISDPTLKTVFFQHFEQLLDNCCLRIDLEFGLQLGRKREKMTKDQYHNLREYLRSIRHDLEQNYLALVKDNFDNSQTQDNSRQPADLSDISLTHDDIMEENNAIAAIIRQCEHLFYDELTQLNRQLASQPGQQTIAGSQHPIFPNKLVHALAEVVKPLTLSTENKIVLYKTFETNVFSQLGIIYRHLF